MSPLARRSEFGASGDASVCGIDDRAQDARTAGCSHDCPNAVLVRGPNGRWKLADDAIQTIMILIVNIFRKS